MGRLPVFVFGFSLALVILACTPPPEPTREPTRPTAAATRGTSPPEAVPREASGAPAAASQSAAPSALSVQPTAAPTTAPPGSETSVEPATPPTPSRRGTVPTAAAPPPSPTPDPTPEPPPAVTFTSVSSGYSHACGIRSDGTVNCWQSPSYYNPAPSPQGAFSSVSVGGSHACGVLTDSSLGCWTFGRPEGNDRGQAMPPQGSFASVSVGSKHTCGVKTDGSVVCWGSDGEGQTRVPGGRTFAAVEARGNATCGLRTDGGVDCWGDQNSRGRNKWPEGSFTAISGTAWIGCGVKTGGALLCWHPGRFGEPRTIEGSFKSVSTSHQVTCGVENDGSLVCWGDNRYRNGVAQDGAFAAVSVGGTHTCAVETGGALVCWGGAERVGVPPELCRVIPDVSLECDDLEPFDLAHPLGRFTAISTPGDYFCGLTTDDYITCQNRRHFYVVRPPASPLTSLTFGRDRACGLVEGGAIQCWGGVGDDIPTGTFTAVDANGWVCGIRTDGSVACPEERKYGLKAPDGPFVSVSTAFGGRTGDAVACALRRDGGVECWGPEWEVEFKRTGVPKGRYSQISVGGDICGVTTGEAIECSGRLYDAGEIPEGPFSSVSVGISHACALKTDGAVRCWGDDSDGQAYSPPGAFTAVSAGAGFSCGLKSDGSAMCWGYTQRR